ncbi:Hsp70 family protein [Mangrovihabitans endophyticus]|nr:Hsp70 family protein [Mangrovihabitans endophyticus]
MPDGTATPLSFDGQPVLSNAAHVSATGTWVGATAWQQADTDPDGFVVSPLAAGDGPVVVAGAVMEPAELIVAALRRVASEATAVAGDRVADVRTVVPAGWGPRRRTWWRRACGKAGLGQVRLVEAPVAAAQRLAPPEAGAPAHWLMIDVGAGCEVSVVRAVAGAGVEVLSTMADAQAGGDRIDAGLADLVLGTGLEELPGGQRWTALASVRAAKHALAEQPAVTVLVPGQPSAVVSTAVLRQAAQPVFARAGELAAEAVANADLSVTDLDAVWAFGAATAVPGSADMIADKLGTTPQASEQPGLVAVSGAAGTAALPPEVTPRPAWMADLPPLRRVAGLLLPGLLSLALFAHFVFAADFYNGTPQRQARFYYVLASWGEATVAALLALLMCLQAAGLIGAALHGQTAGGPAPQRGGPISSGIGVAAAAGLAIAGLYGVSAAVYFGKPVSDPLRWTLTPLVPVVVCAAVLAGLAWRYRPPGGDWDGFLAFPPSSTVAGAAGIAAAAAAGRGHLPVWFNGWAWALGYAGGVLVGVALACTLTRHLALRIVAAPLLGFFCALIAQSGLGILAVIYALAVAAWWAYHDWALFRSGRPAPAP